MPVSNIFKRVLKRGMKGDDVHLLQSQLNQIGYGILSEDGMYGPLTEDAVRRFQLDHTGPDAVPLQVDGIAGPLTWWALFEGTSSKEYQGPFAARLSRLMTASLDVAVRELRRNVREVPAGSNRGPDVEGYLLSVGRKPGDAWCAAFAWWCVERASKSLQCENPLLSTGRVKSLWDDAVSRGSVIHIEDVLRGAIDIPPGSIFCVVNASGRGHAGFVQKRDGDTIFTIEGNTNLKGSSEGDGVYERQRSLSRYKGLKGFVVY